MFFKILCSLVVFAAVLFSPYIYACDNNSCEKAYLAEAQKHVENHVRRANALRAERVAHSQNRERRAYARYVHMHFMLNGANPN